MATDLQQLLADAGIAVTGAIDVVRDCIWSRVLRIPTDRGLAWAKECRGDGGFEPALLQLLADAGETVGPPLLAARDPWLVTLDAGTPLFETDLPVVAILADMQASFAQLQRRWLDRTDELRATGIPVFGLADLPALTQRLVEVCRTQFAAVEDALTEPEYEALAYIAPRLQPHLDRLDALGIGVTIQHDDFHPGNVLVAADGARTVIDWGDASVTHPFTHLMKLVGAIEYRYELGGDAPEVEAVRTAYLEQWTDVAPLDVLRDAAHSAEYVGAITRTESWRRALAFADLESMAAYGSNVPKTLRRLIA